jgi:cytochrome oxidase Cu insertion factor (SCO1/SenC/PrrC family)
MTRRDTLGVSLLAAVGLITAAWWALALWPLDPNAPTWLVRTRFVCFGSTANGLPHAGGWIALIGEPVAMTGLLMVVWGDAVSGGLRALYRSAAGRVALVAAGTITVAAVWAAGGRVARAAAAPALEPITLDAGVTALDRPAPPLALVDQLGRPFALEAARGRPVLVTFAFGHCETICPIVVHDVLETAARRPDLAPLAVIVTLDPWRDLPSRLPAIARAWRVSGDARVLGGTVDEVLRTIAAWGVTIERDARTGDVTHPAVVYVVDRAGTIRYAAPGGPDVLVELLDAL